jgi:hypothetical protein
LPELDRKRMERELKEYTGRFSELLHANVPRARQVLGKLLEEPIWITPTAGGGYTFNGKTRIGPLLPVTSVSMASPRGFEPLLPP